MQFTVNFTKDTWGDPAPTYDVYVDDVKVATNIQPGWTYTAKPGIYSVKVEAVNKAGKAMSSAVTAISVDPWLRLNKGIAKIKKAMINGSKIVAVYKGANKLYPPV